MNPLRLGSILLFSTAVLGTLQSQTILVAGVLRPEKCAFATKPMIQDLKGIGFPHDWTFVVACSSTAWEKLQRKGNVFGTNTAFTNLKGRMTILNGKIYQQSLPLCGTSHRTPKSVLRHEYGHIVCKCNDEARADEAAGLN